MVNDIQKAIIANPVKNGSSVTSTSFVGAFQTYDRYVKNTPDMTVIQAKYDNRFYNGIFVQLVGNQTIVGA